MGTGLLLNFADVRGHLKAVALALVVDRALLHVRVGNGIGLDGVELEVGGGGVEVGRGTSSWRSTALERSSARKRGAAGSSSNAMNAATTSFLLTSIDFLVSVGCTKLGTDGLSTAEPGSLFLLSLLQIAALCCTRQDEECGFAYVCLAVSPDSPDKIALGVCRRLPTLHENCVAGDRLDGLAQGLFHLAV